MKAIRILVTLIIILILALAVCFVTKFDKLTHQSDQNHLEKVRIGYLPIAAGLPLFVALEKGYFQEAGFDPELHRFASSNDLGTAGAADQIEALMPFALNAAFDIGAVSGIHHRLFGINIYSDQPPHIVDSLVIRRGLQISSLADIRGKRVGAFPGSVTKIFVENILAANGVKPGEYTYLELGPKDWQAALTAGSVDVASVMEPQLSQITADGAEPYLFPVSSQN